MKKYLGLAIFIVFMVGIVYFRPKVWMNPLVTEKPLTANLTLAKYDFDSLKQRGGIGGEIKILGPIKEVEDRRSSAKKVYKNKFTTSEISFESNGKKISGMINYYPERSSLSPVIIMVRGYAASPGYYTGSGSWAVADKLAEAGYTTISLDFLGFADSDKESTDILEARFEKVVSLMDLIESIKKLSWVDENKIGIWAHSNGGQIVLSTLEVTGGNYPTALWAPMTNPFPQSVIETIDASSLVKETIAEFQKHYDARRYAFENYYDWIRAPVLIQQGTADVWCKVDWQQGVVDKLNANEKQAELVVYEGNDHNLKKSWDEAVARDLEFFGDKLR